MGIYSGQTDTTATIHYSSYTFDENKINVEYFKRFLKSSEFIELLKEQIKGGIKTEIKPKHILPLVIQLPSLLEQKNIVSHFKSIESEDKELNDEITHQQELLKKLRQAILQEAIEGQLTKDWRNENPNVENASVLLKKIKAEKIKLIAEKKIKKQKPLPSIEKDEIPFEIPENWVWCRLGEIAEPITYGIVKLGIEPKYSGVFTLRTSDVKYRYISTIKTRKVTEHISNKYKRTILKGGEILINVRGTLGGCAIVPNEIKGFNVSREVSVVPLINNQINEHILNVISSPFSSNEIDKNLRGIAYKGLNLNLLSLFPVPLPPLSEQKEIVKKVEHLFAMCDELETQITQSKANAEMLMQAVLKEAFSN